MADMANSDEPGQPQGDGDGWREPTPEQIARARRIDEPGRRLAGVMLMFFTPISWVFQEKFWRDVATQTIAGGIVVGLGYTYGVAAGTIPPPSNDNFVFNVIVVGVSFVASLIVTLLIVAQFWRPDPRMRRSPLWWDMAPRRDVRRATILILVMVFLPIVLTVVLTWTVLQFVSS
ncbi:hypothetical protein ACEWX3_07660 [Mycobacterium sp. G7A2]|uniref:hypothetical protein n=1 Tax=Mycobacterium sp. G7A2 TaxID=3317307 RepID=UPI0035A93AB7